MFTTFTLYIVTGFSVWALWGSQLPGSRKARNPNDASRSEGARPLVQLLRLLCSEQGHCNQSEPPRASNTGCCSCIQALNHLPPR